MDSSEWTGRVGDVWAEEWRRTDRSFVPVDEALIEAALSRLAGITAPRMLDIGCGAGGTSISLADRLPAASVVGIDLSPALIAVASARAADHPRVSFEQADAGQWEGQSGFDLLVSRHGVMFFDDPIAAFTHLRSLVRPGGGIAFSCFQSAAKNPWASGLPQVMPPADGRPPAPGPFAFAEQAYVAGILARAGWSGEAARPLPFRYVAGAGDDPVGDAMDYFRRIGPVARALRDLDGVARDRLLEELQAVVRAHYVGDVVAFPAAAWIWSATA